MLSTSNSVAAIFFCFILLDCNIKKVEAVKSPDATGKEIYSDRCLVCHGSDGALGMNGAKNLSLSKLPLEEVILQVANGKGAMTPFKNILSPEEIKRVSQYSMSLRSK